MPMKKNIKRILLLTLLVGLSACTSVDTRDEDALLSFDFDSAEGFPDGDDFFAEDFAAIGLEEDDFFAEDFAFEGFEEDPFPSEPQDTTFDDFAFDDFEEEPFTEDFAAQDLAAQESEFDFDDFFGDAEESFPEESFFEEDLFAAEPLAPTPPPSPVAEVTDIRYLANQNGGTVVIETSAPMPYQTRFNEETNQYIIEVSDVRLPDRLKRPYIMRDFDGPFASINAYQSQGSTTARVVIQLRAPGTPQPIVQQEGLTLAVIPASSDLLEDDFFSGYEEPVIADAGPTPGQQPQMQVDDREWMGSYDVERASRDEKALGARTLDEFLTGSHVFYGREISIEVRDADIRDVLALIANESGINMVISEEVTGKLSLKLRRIPWDQALITVMRARNLGYIRQGNVIRISSLSNLQQEAATAKSILDSQKALAPLRVKVIPVSYARVEDMVNQVQTFLTRDRGKVVADVRTSSLIITDTDDVLRRVERLIRDLDTAPAQVLIEGRIVEASETFQRRIGINWGYDGVPLQLSPSGGLGGSPINMITNVGSTPVAGAVLQESPLSMGLRIGQLNFFGNLDARLSLAETDTLVRVLSSPRVVAMNKERAQITQKGENVTFSTVVDSQGQSTRSVVRTPVVVELAVTPQITADGSIIMDVDLKREFPGPLLDAESLAREINSRSANTKILVRNGETAVIGGIYQSDTLQSDTGVPWLKDLPIFGWLFKARNMERTKNELLLFLTPRILNLQNQFDSAQQSGGNVDFGDFGDF